MSEGSSNPDFSLADGHGYVLDRSHAAACRLNLQFYLWKDAIKFNIHPSIPIPKSGIIADVATGTGMWLIDVARELPTAQLDGFDIDLSQAPPQQWLPSNATLGYWNIFENLPDDWVLQIPRFAREIGFEDVHLYHFGDGNELARAFNEQHLLTMEEFAVSLTKIGKRDAASRVPSTYQRRISGVPEGSDFLYPKGRLCCTQSRLKQS